MTRRSKAAPVEQPTLDLEATAAIVDDSGDVLPSVPALYLVLSPGHVKRRENDYGHDQPSVVNVLSLRRYRITAELIDEPIEVLRERLTQLFLTSEYNGHHMERFARAAVELGMPPFEWRLMGLQHRKDRR